MAKGSLQASKILSPHGRQGTLFLSAPTQCPRQDESLGFLSLEFLGPTSIHLKSPGAASTLLVGEIPRCPMGGEQAGGSQQFPAGHHLGSHLGGPTHLAGADITMDQEGAENGLRSSLRGQDLCYQSGGRQCQKLEVMPAGL